MHCLVPWCHHVSFCHIARAGDLDRSDLVSALAVSVLTPPNHHTCVTRAVSSPSLHPVAAVLSQVFVIISELDRVTILSLVSDSRLVPSSVST